MTENQLQIRSERHYYHATTGRPGPVIIDIPKDLTDPNVKIDFEYKKYKNSIIQDKNK